MGRDKVLGLSLAILVIGFAAAFCFRNEQFMQDGLKMARSSFLDDAVAERPGPKPYPESKHERKRTPSPTVTLQDIETLEAASDMRVARNTEPEPAKKGSRKKQPIRDVQVSLKEPLSPIESPGTPPPNPEPTSPPMDDSAPQSAPSEQVAANEPPVQTPETTSRIETTPEIVIRPGARHVEPAKNNRSHEMTWQPVVEKRERPATDAHPITKADEEPAEIVYRVKRGDTLTRIARHYLGDGNRYLEIYSANKDKLQSPDDRLRIGTLLRIPKTSNESEPVIGPTAAKKGVPYRTGVATRQRRSRTASIRNVSRTRKLPQPPRTDKNQDADKSPETKRQETDKNLPSDKIRSTEDNPRSLGQRHSDENHRSDDNRHSEVNRHSEESRPSTKSSISEKTPASEKTPVAHRTPPAAKPTGTEGKTTTSNGDEPVIAPKQDIKIKFGPVRRSPFLPGRSESSNSNAPAGRTLSQKPPEDPPADATQKDSLRSDDPDVSRLDATRRTTTASKVGGKFEDVQLR